MRGRAGMLAAAVAALVVVLVAAAVLPGDDAPEPAPATTTTTAPPPVLDASAYEGLGAWIDVFDYAPAYQRAGQDPLIEPDVVDVLAARGVDTLFLQAARLDDRSPDGIPDEVLVGELLQRARLAGIHVVGWYLPRFADVDADLERLLQIHTFSHEGHHFDGIAVDIEFRADVPDHPERTRRLVELSERLREAVGDRAIGAIVPPPVLMEEVNADFWAGFPWGQIAPYYDVWLPMTYWSFRTTSSGWRDGERYTEESIVRMRAHVGDPTVPVHPIGGIADDVSEDDLAGFAAAALRQNAIGLSVYDLRTTTGGGWAVLRRAAESVVPVDARAGGGEAAPDVAGRPR